MKDIKQFLTEASNSSIVKDIETLFASCETSDDYKAMLNSLSFALHKVAESKVKHNKKQPSYKADLEFASAVNSLRIEFSNVINDDKIWRDID